MKKFIYILLGLTLTTAVSCSEDFLEKDPSENMSDEEIEEIAPGYPELSEALLRGIYENMYKTGSGGTDLDHDDFGQKGYDIYSDLLSGDMVLGGLTYGWYSNVSQMLSPVDFTNNDNYKPWRYYYRIVNGANSVIDGYGGNDAKLEAGSDAIYSYSQARAMRAYAYFYLAQLFAESYDPSALILPIYTSLSQPNQPLSSTQDVYDFIVEDLTYAVKGLEGFQRESKSYVNQTVAQALLAYTYAAMGENEMAKQLSNDAILSSGANLVSKEEATGGFNDVNTSGWIWGTDINLNSNLDLVSWWGQVDLFTYSYAWAGDPKIIGTELLDAIKEDDVRKGQFINAYGDGQYYPINKFYSPERVVGGQRNVTTDYLYMRIAEMYLLNAETAAKTGDEGTAKTSLKALLDLRMDDTSYIDALSGDALLQEILLQTRIELWGEGKSYLLMKRNKSAITLPSNHLSFPGLVIPSDDDRLTFDIPQSEIQNNPNIN
ncbi:RagB/SusD family nutrient uptake outer membrane protein [Pseudotamlana carrageenivorans]|uniref:RagB/SusD family nutrient uptake outer membrane protein n=1 Tax=Pseudotamlana carrageenivorans TaxID=2069432 RepID=A0A2I7SFG9_9FLAO|nr:RagB/SusD family nutrient uptake outer membrane protein [Tamlana carrageenivorans]AUS04659.1 RagB/SusD family nutrient uptake outer membrane protein [Tamlana carrageenivorans]